MESGKVLKLFSMRNNWDEWWYFTGRKKNLEKKKKKKKKKKKQPPKYRIGLQCRIGLVCK